MDILLFVLMAIAGYLLGSINGAVFISKIFYGSDIRTHGSGNAGTTNMLRTFGKKAAAGTFLVDLLKGVVAALLCGLVMHLLGKNFGYEMGACIGGAFSILGHNWPLYFGFKGGKGVLTSFAVLVVLAPLPALSALLTFIVVVAITRYVSLGSIIGAATLPLFTWLWENVIFDHTDLSPVFFLGIFAAILLICRHHANIGRLLHGTESKLGQKSKKEQEQ